jgi:hypothetical protein
MIRESIRNIVYQKKMKILILKLVLISILLSASKGSEGKSSKIMLTVYQAVSLFSRKLNLSSLRFMNQTNRNKAFEIGPGIVQAVIYLQYCVV